MENWQWWNLHIRQAMLRHITGMTTKMKRSMCWKAPCAVYCGEQTWRATKGSFVWLPRGIPHGYAVDGDETLRTLAITLPAGFASFVIEAGEPAAARQLPLPGPMDIEKVATAGARHGIVILGPPRA